jgi:hypothetical protein
MKVLNTGYSTSLARSCTVAGLVVLVVAEDDDTSNNNGGGADPVDILGSLDGLGPFLIGLACVIFVLHVLVQPNWMLLDLMQTTYLAEGITIQGTALDCEERPNHNPPYLVEVMWEYREHRYADNPSLKFRHPDAYETKRFVRRFDFENEVSTGAMVPVLLPHRGAHAVEPRSGCPTHVVERIHAQEASKIMRSRFILRIGIILIAILLGLTIPQINAMDNPTHGWVVLVVVLVVMEAVSFLYSTDAFLKEKARVFDSAVPMIDHETQQARKELEAAAPKTTADPFSIPLNEFAGHARATGRNR